MLGKSALADFVAGLASHEIEVVDLSVPLGPDTPLIKLPPEIGRNTPKVEIHAISNYDKDGPYWAWNWLKLGEHSGTHFDAPVHWITGRDYVDGTTDKIAARSFVAPACVIDCSAATSADADFLLDVPLVQSWETVHGAIPAGSWVLMRTDWSKRNHDEALYLNADEHGPHSPGPTAACIEFLLNRGILGWGTETIGTDAGAAAGMTPPFPAHNLLHKANRYGLASLCNLDRLPPTGAVIIAAPLKIVGGTGSPVRALALVPGGKSA